MPGRLSFGQSYPGEAVDKDLMPKLEHYQCEYLFDADKFSSPLGGVYEFANRSRVKIAPPPDLSLVECLRN